MKLLRCILIFLALHATVLRAQEAVPQRITTVFRTLGLGVNLTGIYYLYNNKDVPVSVLEDTRSEFYPLTPALAVQFYRLEKSQDGTLLRLPVAKATLPGNAKVMLLVFGQGPAKSMVVETMDESLAAFPGGSYRFVNRTDQRLEALVKEQKATVPEAGTVLVNARGAGPTVFVQLFTQGTARPQLFLSNNWAFNAAIRTLVVVEPPVAPSKTPMVRRIIEPITVLQPPPPTPSAPLTP